MIFADTGALYAVLVKADENHARAHSWIQAHRQEARLLTTDYVLDEVLTLLRARGQLARARVTAGALFAGKVARIHHVSEEDLNTSAEVFDRFGDKEWSFTDCVSYAVIARLGIKKAFAFDEHFRQFGIVEVVP
ncbi:MAG: type II toxin-antitoxin system VapC family toxin [Planctomycetes bacterium]|nr:type II toxin-antitoxin system VapC family toxin [Planctomycetota bacterium]